MDQKRYAVVDPSGRIRSSHTLASDAVKAARDGDFIYDNLHLPLSQEGGTVYAVSEKPEGKVARPVPL